MCAVICINVESMIALTYIVIYRGSFMLSCFYCRPQLWFSLRILKGLEITNIPFLHNWLYHYIVNRFTECK